MGDFYLYWIPTANLEINKVNGSLMAPCLLQVISGGHLAGKVARHTCCWKDTWYIETDEEDAAKSLSQLGFCLVWFFVLLHPLIRLGNFYLRWNSFISPSKNFSYLSYQSFFYL